MTWAASSQQDLFGSGPPLPEGLRYETGFLDAAEEAALLARLPELPFAPMAYKGYLARRRVVSYGGRYDFDALALREAPALPDWLAPLREKAAAWSGIAAESFTQALVAEYQPGTPLGWHRDVPDFEEVLGVSLLDTAVMRWRPWPHEPGRRAGPPLELALAPRSIYLMRGAARWAWQHSIVPTPALRYSITLRTLRARPSPPGRHLAGGAGGH